MDPETAATPVPRSNGSMLSRVVGAAQLQEDEERWARQQEEERAIRCERVEQQLPLGLPATAVLDHDVGS